MRGKIFSIAILFVTRTWAAGPITASVLPAQSLSQAYAAALKRSENIDIQKELVVQARENKSQATGALLPTISGYGNWTHQAVANPYATGGSNSTDTRTTKITGDQPLFRGFRDFAELKQRKYLVEAQVFDFKNAAKQLFYDLSTAYYNVLALQSDENDYKSEIEVNRKRLVELKHFLQIGRSRNTDLLTFQSNISALESQLEATHGQLEIAKDVLAFLTGWHRDTPLSDTEDGTIGGSIDEHLARIDRRPDVQAALKSAQAAGEGVSIARGGHWPDLDLVGNYYFDRPGIPSYQEDWDVQLVLTVPLFEGGIVQSQVRQAQSVSRQGELTLSQTRRQAEQEIRTLYDAWMADQKQVEKLKETFDWAKKSYDAELGDYRRGLVTNLEVLQAITTYQDSQRLLDRQRYAVRLDAVKLQAATARRDEIDVNPDNEKKP